MAIMQWIWCGHSSDDIGSGGSDDNMGSSGNIYDDNDDNSDIVCKEDPVVCW